MHDFGLEAWRQSLFSPETWLHLQLTNAGLNVAVLIAWSAWLWPRRLTTASRPVAARTA
jgi:hypothetical protein